MTQSGGHKIPRITLKTEDKVVPVEKILISEELQTKKRTV